MTDKPSLTCATCRWWLRTNKHADGPNGEISGHIRDHVTGSILYWWLGKCRIRAPQPAFSLTACHDFCGEHTPQTEAEA